MASDFVIREESYSFDVRGEKGPSWGKTEYVEVKVSDLPDYEGSYDVTPTVDGLTLGTKERSLHEDVTVHEIPVQRTSNQSDGVTVSIAS